MPIFGQLEVKTPSDTEIAMKRVFNAPRDLVYDAFTKPALLKRWFHGAPGWRMHECEVDLRVGGAYRYLWHEDGGAGRLGIRGTFWEIVTAKKLVVSERYDDAWYPGDAATTTTFTEHAGKTTLLMTVRYASKEVRDMVLQTPMATGVSAGMDSLADFLAAELAERSRR